jgi:hypothetical protein
MMGKDKGKLDSIQRRFVLLLRLLALHSFKKEGNLRLVVFNRRDF